MPDVFERLTGAVPDNRESVAKRHRCEEFTVQRSQPDQHSASAQRRCLLLLTDMLLSSILGLLAVLVAIAFTSRGRNRRAARDLLTPAYVTSLIARHWKGVSVAEVEVCSIAHCGDGKASTTDRIELRLTFTENAAQLPNLGTWLAEVTRRGFALSCGSRRFNWWPYAKIGA